MKKLLCYAVAIFLIVMLGNPVFSQDTIDNPNLDQIPQWYLNRIQTQQRQASEVITINDYDNFLLGVDFAEGHISANPLVPSEFFTAFNTNGSHYTIDGHSWNSSNPSWGSSMRGDPVIAYDSLGNLYYENMYGSPNILGCKVVRSMDNGQTWLPAVNAISGNDKNWIACDQTSGPFANYVYTTMTNNGVGNFARSTDYGTTWESIFHPTTQSLPGMMVCVGASGSTQGGAVYVVTNSGNSFASTYTFYRSLDGGTTFTQMSSNNFAGYVGTNVNGRNSVENMRTRPYPMITADNSYGLYRGRLHLVYASNDPPGNGNKPDIWSRYSDDGGATWSDAMRVNSDVETTQNHQWQPATWCDKETGKLYIQWMDTRDTPTHDSAMIYATYSDDGGQSFYEDQRISNEKMKINCSTCGGGGTPRYQGDYNGIVSNSNVSNLTWADFRWGSFASFTSYFPDFAMRVFPLTQQIEYSDTVWAVIPGVKLYDNQAVFSASIETPSSGSFTIEFPLGNILTTFPDSIPIVITSNLVPVGDYTLTIKAEGPNGTPVHFRSAVINVLPTVAPIADFSASETTTCQGQTIDFTNESIGATTAWLWTFEGGNPATSTEENPIGITYATNGTFDVSIEVSNSAGSDFITKTGYITIKPIPESPSGENLSVCKNDIIPNLTATGENIMWYADMELTNLVFEGNEFQTGEELPGIYTYYLTQTVDGCTSEPDSLSLTIFDTPVITFVQMDSVCLNSTAFELGNAQPMGGEYFGTGVTDGIFDPAVAGVGTHTLGYRYADVNSCADTVYQNITVLALPEVTLENFASVCTYTEAFQIAGGTPAGGVYAGTGVVENWFYPEIAGAGEHEIFYVVIDSLGCSNTSSKQISVFEPPIVTIGNDTTVCGSQSVVLNAAIPNAISYLWNPGGYTTSSITVDSIGIGFNSQEYSVLVTDENVCAASDSIVITFINCSGVNEITELKNVSIYPNPNDGVFNLSASSTKAITVDLKVVDAAGKSVMEQKQLVINGSFTTEISLPNIKSGIYFISLQNEKGMFVRKFFVK